MIPIRMCVRIPFWVRTGYGQGGDEGGSDVQNWNTSATTNISHLFPLGVPTTEEAKSIC